MARRGKGLLFAPRRKKRLGCLMLSLLLFLALALVLALNSVNNRHVTLLKQDVTVLGLHQDLEGFRVLHLSDLHAARFGEGQQRVRDLLRYERYDAVCLTGDMVGKSGNAEPLMELIALVPEGVPVFLIAGDDDPQAKGALKPDYAARAESAGAIWLDSPRYLEKGGRKVWFVPASLYLQDLSAARFASDERRQQLTGGGIGLSPDDELALQQTDYQLEILAKAEGARKLMHDEDAYVLLSHFPLDAERMANLRPPREGEEERKANFPGKVSLVLAGHWNNGQWRLPFLGALWVPSGTHGLSGWLPDDKAVSGLITVHGLNQYISPGLGASGAYPWQPFRLFNRPAVTILKLSAKVAL